MYLVFSALDLDLGQLLSPAAPPHFLRQNRTGSAAGSPLVNIATKKLDAQDCQGFWCVVISVFLYKKNILYAQCNALSHAWVHFPGLAVWEEKNSPVGWASRCLNRRRGTLEKGLYALAAIYLKYVQFLIFYSRLVQTRVRLTQCKPQSKEFVI